MVYLIESPAFAGRAGSPNSVNMACRALVRRRVVTGDMSGSMSSGSFEDLVVKLAPVSLEPCLCRGGKTT